MSTNIDIFTLPDNVVEKMKELLKIKTESEAGFTMCARKTDNIIEVKNVTTEFSEKVRLKTNCPTGFISIGTYHTHPTRSSRASGTDLANTCDHIADCIGSAEDNKIKCYIKRKDTDNIDCTKNLNEFVSLVENPINNRHDQFEREMLEIENLEKMLTIPKTRTRKTDVEEREIRRKINTYDRNIEKFNSDIRKYLDDLKKLQDRHFIEKDIL